MDSDVLKQGNAPEINEVGVDPHQEPYCKIVQGPHLQGWNLDDNSLKLIQVDSSLRPRMMKTSNRQEQDSSS